MAVSPDWKGWLSYAIIFTSITVGITIWFWKRRKIQPIRARQPGLCVGMAIMYMIWTITLVILRIFRKENVCLLSLWLSYLGTVVIFNFYMVRCFLLFANFNITQQMIEARTEAQEQLKTQPTENMSEKKIKKKFRKDINKKVLKGSYIVKYLIPASCLLLVSPLIFTFTNPALRTQTLDGCQDIWQGGAFVLVAYAVVYMFIFIYIAWKIQGVVDAFYIKKELKATGIVGVLCAIPFYVLNNWDDDSIADANNSTSASTWILIMFVLYAFCLIIVMPLLLTYRGDVKLHVETPEVLKGAETCLASELGYKAFVGYLSTEFSVQHAYYWKDVDVLERRVADMKRKGCGEGEVKQVIVTLDELYQRYVIPDAPNEINIGLKLRKNITVVYDECGTGEYKPNAEEESKDNNEDTPADIIEHIITPYRAAQQNVLRKMLKDSYRRFKRSKHFQEVYAELTKWQARQEHFNQTGVMKNDIELDVKMQEDANLVDNGQ